MIKLLQWEFFLDVISSIISSYQTGVWKVETSICQIVFQEKQACQRSLVPEFIEKLMKKQKGL